MCDLEDWENDEAAKKKQADLDLIEEARERTQSISTHNFLDSLEEWLESHSELTARQRASVKEILSSW